MSWYFSSLQYQPATHTCSMECQRSAFLEHWARVQGKLHRRESRFPSDICICIASSHWALLVRNEIIFLLKRWAACDGADAIVSRGNLLCGSTEKASAFTETRINCATMGFGSKCKALFTLLLLGVQRKAQFLIEKLNFRSVLWSRWKTQRQITLYLSLCVFTKWVGLFLFSVASDTGFAVV